MPKASPIRSSFNAGELSPMMDGRVEVAKYQAGCKVLENFIPAVQGPAVRRAGTRFVAEVKSSNSRTWLAKFEFSNTQAYVLEFGSNYLRFYTNHGQVVTLPANPYDSSTAYAIGSTVTSGTTQYYCIAATTGNAPPNATYWYALTGLVYEIPTPWSGNDLTDTTDATFTLSMAQSGDVIYIAHPNYPLQKLSRYSATKWTLTPVAFTNGPFKTQNSTRTLTVYAAAATGTTTLTASSALFTSSMVGSYIYLEPADLSVILPWVAGQEFTANPLNTLRRSDGKTYKCTTNGVPTAGKSWRTGADKPIHTYGTQSDGDGSARIGTNIEREGLAWQYQNAGYGYVKVTGYTSATQVTVVVQGTDQLPDGVVGAGNATFRWAMGSFSAAEGYPNRVTFFRERLALSKGQQLYFSVTGDFENFAALDSSGQVVADRAIQATISSEQVNTVQWLSPSQALIIGTSGGEFVCGENATSEGFGPGNIKIEQQTSDGSRTVTPVRVGYSTLMVQRSGRKVKEIAYSFQQNGYVTADMTVMADHVTQGGIVQVAWHREPYVAMWAVRNDGQLLGFTFNKEQDVIGWHRHILGGKYAADVNIFSVSGTWTKPANLVAIDVIVIGGGGGGQSGRLVGSVSANNGGMGGGAGGYSKQTFTAASLPSSVAVTIGAGGAAVIGASGTAVGAAVTGNNGYASSFGSLLTAGGGFGGNYTTYGGGGSNGGTGTTQNGGTGGLNDTTYPAKGGTLAPGGGGGGAAFVIATNGPVAGYNGGMGSSSAPIPSLGGVGGASNFAGSAGARAVSDTIYAGGGGGGGGSGNDINHAAGDGSYGGFPGGGGGGGGASMYRVGEPGKAGNGGAGATGAVIIIEYFA